MRLRIDRRHAPALTALALAGLGAGAAPALGREAVTQPEPAVSASDAASDTAAAAPDTTPATPAATTAQSGPSRDIIGLDTFTVLVDLRLVAADGEKSWVNNGLGKTRFQGTSTGGYAFKAIPAEADLVWEPRLSNSLSANVSAAWQRDQQHAVDLIEAFVTYLPQNTGRISFSGRAGLMWPEISLEHSTGGAWSVVNTITPSAINSWVGEETKVIGAEGTVHAELGEHELLLTGGIFGYNDTSGTLLSFRGWALHDEKATAFGHFPLPPRSVFLTGAQQGETLSTLEIDDKPGFYGRVDWRPPWPFGLAVFYYDNEGDPKAFNTDLQWGWRTRFWNVGLNADLTPKLKLLAQGMTGSTIMGFDSNGIPWVHTDFSSAYLLLSRSIAKGRGAVTGRVETFETSEHGSEMQGDDGGETGWAATAAVRWVFSDHVTGFLEALRVHSDRPARATLLNIPPMQTQTVFQASLRLKL